MLLYLMLAAPLHAGWREALPGWEFEFPRDHGPHRDFKTEWWYFTGNLQDADGRRFGYELTFFRQGLRPPDVRQPDESAWIANEIALAHFAVTDAAGGRFYFDHRLLRVGLGLADFTNSKIHIDDWSLRFLPDGGGRIVARSERMSLDLTLAAGKPPAVHGTNGVSQKSAGAGRASHYYSLSRMRSEGTLTLSGRATPVTGDTWFDHEWASNQLTGEQAGWDWFGLHLADGSDLMLYQLRLKNGGTDLASSGTLVRPDGTAIHLPRDAFRLIPGDAWTSPETKVRYPLHWKIEVPAHGLSLEVTPVLDDQEMRVPPAAYWEGAMTITGSTTGTGYMELTGYGGKVIGLTE